MAWLWPYREWCGLSRTIGKFSLTFTLSTLTVDLIDIPIQHSLCFSACQLNRPTSFLALSMRNKQSLICFLLGYLVLLWNLGPSLHRADIFGFHSHAHANAGDSFDFTAAQRVSCCHCHCHSHSKPRHTDDQESDAPRSFIDAHHDCPFCQFFDQLHVMISHAELTEAKSSVFLVEAVDLLRIETGHISPSARGPPATC